MAQEILEKSYTPSSIEQKWYSYWESRNYFAADNQSTAPRFSIVIPPPNVTGSLHMGHALQHTLHDILVRWKRMSGFNTLWLPGMDHASIAVHYVLDKQFEAEKKTRFHLGREKFLEIAWKWKETSGGTILNQMRRLGVSCDWSRERFTMDEGLANAVKEVFVRLYEEGLIYRGEYIVHWCTRCKTAISDLEVVHEARQGSLWHIKYPVPDTDLHISVATTRPETMLGDTAVAVHPDDDRYRNMVGREVLLPLANRKIPVIADSFVDRDFGSGAVKVTPAHDPKDYEAGLRHHLPRVTVIDDDGKMTEAAGRFAGMDRFECRKRLVAQLEQDGYLLRIDDYKYNVGQCDRCSSVVEPKISLQWFLKVDSLAKPAIQVVEDGRIQFVPESFKKRYFEWMYNIHDWCISRQLWWGHRIPAFYCDRCSEVIVSRDTIVRCLKCGGSLREETDVLDTWFSSALWPFSTMGWPEQTEDLRLFYPTDVLITGPDIIFFWVARMIMMGMKYMGQVPFRQVHINGIVRDASNKKMSKTRGNVIDPLGLIEQYGADAVRFTLSSMAVPGTDIPFSSDRMQGYSAFANKVWNAARFLLMNLREDDAAVPAEEIDALLEVGREHLSVEDRWILHRLDRLSAEVGEELHRFRFHDASSKIYQFFWHEFCDWYIELIKPVLSGESAVPGERETRVRIIIHVMDYALRVLHPFMPHITEEIWQKIPHEGESIMVQTFPKPRPNRSDSRAEAEMDLLMELISGIRSGRSEMNIEPKRRLDAFLIVTQASSRRLVEENLEKVLRLAKLNYTEFCSAFPDGRVLLKGVCRIGEYALDLAGAIDLAVERERLQKEIAHATGEIQKILKKIENPEFLTRAPFEVVQENRRRYEELRVRITKLEANLRGLD